METINVNFRARVVKVPSKVAIAGSRIIIDTDENGLPTHCMVSYQTLSDDNKRIDQEHLSFKLPVELGEDLRTACLTKIKELIESQDKKLEENV